MSVSTAAPVQPFVWSVRVYYEDTDAGGVVYYANYLKYFERARTEWLRSVGFAHASTVAELGIQFVVVALDCDYRRPARLDDLLRLDVQVMRARQASIVFAQSAWRGEELLATAQIRVACVDVRHFGPRPLPKAMLAAAQTLAKTDSRARAQ